MVGERVGPNQNVLHTHLLVSMGTIGLCILQIRFSWKKLAEIWPNHKNVKV